MGADREPTIYYCFITYFWKLYNHLKLLQWVFIFGFLLFAKKEKWIGLEKNALMYMLHVTQNKTHFFLSFFYIYLSFLPCFSLVSFFLSFFLFLFICLCLYRVYSLFCITFIKIFHTQLVCHHCLFFGEGIIHIMMCSGTKCPVYGLPWF